MWPLGSAQVFLPAGLIRTISALAPAPRAITPPAETSCWLRTGAAPLLWLRFPFSSFPTSTDIGQAEAQFEHPAQCRAASAGLIAFQLWIVGQPSLGQLACLLDQSALMDESGEP